MLKGFAKFVVNDLKKGREEGRLLQYVVFFPFVAYFTAVLAYDTIGDELTRRELLQRSDTAEDKNMERMKKLHIRKDSVLRAEERLAKGGGSVPDMLLSEAKESIADNAQSIERIRQRYNDLHLKLVRYNNRIEPAGPTD